MTFLLSGVAGLTNFVFKFEGWRDEDERPVQLFKDDKYPILLYEVLQYGEVKMPFIYSGG